MAKTRAWTADGSAPVPARATEGIVPSAADPMAILHGAPRSALVAVDPREVAMRVRELVGDLARAKAVDVVIECTCSRIWVEPQAFSEAVYELLDNAVHAAPASHPVIIDVRDTADGDVLWQVQDAGEGMTAETLAQLGDPFPAARPGVLCLGVALASAIVEAHGGMLRFESTPGVGTTASIWLPGTRSSDARRETAGITRQSSSS